MDNEILKRILETQEAMAKSQEAIFSELKELKQGQAKLEGSVTKLEGSVAKLEGSVAKLEESVDRLHGSVAVIENDHGKSLGVLHNEFKYVRETFDRIEPVVEKTALDVAILTTSVSVHSDKFTALKAAI